MFYQEYAPPPALAPFIRLFWVQTCQAGELAPIRIVTDGIVEVVFHFGDSFITQFEKLAPTRQPPCFAIAQMEGPIRIQPLGRVGILAVRFQPWGAYHFMDLPSAALGTDCVPLCELWGRKTEALHEAIVTAASHERRLLVLQSFLLTRLARPRPEPWQADAYIRRVCAGDWRISISEVSAELGFSRRTVERRIRETYGVSPKHLSKIQRFLFACSIIRSGPFESLTETAHYCGYYDQSHFNHDFLRFSGQTPSAFARDDHSVF